MMSDSRLISLGSGNMCLETRSRTVIRLSGGRRCLLSSAKPTRADESKLQLNRLHEKCIGMS